MTHINIGGSWKDIREAHCNIGGTWKRGQSLWVNIGGTWKKSWEARIYLYNEGDEADSGGWYRHNYSGNGNLSKGANSLHLSASDGGYVSAFHYDGPDRSVYSKLRIDAQWSAIDATLAFVGASTTQAEAVIVKYSSFSRQLLTVDVSAKTWINKVLISTTAGASGTSSVNVYKIYFDN